MHFMANKINNTHALDADYIAAVDNDLTAFNSQQRDTILINSEHDPKDRSFEYDDNNSHYYYLMCVTIGTYILENTTRYPHENDDKKFIAALFYGYWFLSGEGAVVI